MSTTPSKPIAALSGDMSGRTRSRSANRARATSKDGPPGRRRSSVHAQSAHPFNSQEQWESLVNASAQAEADLSSDEPCGPSGAPRGESQPRVTRKRLNNTHITDLSISPNSDNEAVNSPPAPVPKRRRPTQVQAGRDDEDRWPEREDPGDDPENNAGGQGLGKKELQDIAAAQKQSRRVKTNQSYTYADKKFWWYCQHHGGEGDIAAGIVRDHALDGSLIDSAGLALAVRYIRWVGNNCPGYTGARHAATLSLSAFNKQHSALQSLYNQQLMESNDTYQPESCKLMAYGPYRASYDTVTNRLAEKGQRPDDNHDPLDNTGQETFTTAQILLVNRHLLSVNQADADRDHAMNMWLFNVTGRSDDGRLVYQPDFLPPRQIKSIGPCPAMVLAAVVNGGKSQKNGKVGYLGCIRHKDPLRCAHAAIGRMMVRRYTIDKASFPDPRQKNFWNKEFPCFPAKHGSKENLSCEQQAASMRKYLKELKIFIKKLTHAWRVAGSRAKDAAGVDDKVIARMDKWIYEAMYQSYLEFFKPSGLMGAAGWEGAATNELRMFFAERFFIVVPEELEVFLFPFLPELKRRVESLGSKAGSSMKASILVFKYLALVVIQDAAGGLAAQYPNHDVHKLLYQSQAFRTLEGQHRKNLAAKEFEPYRPQLLADQVRDLKSMVFQMAMQQQTGKVPVFLSQSKHFKEAASMTLEDEQNASHAAFQHILELADAGKQPPVDQLDDMEPIPAPPGQLLESSQQHLQTSGSPPSTSALVTVTSADSVHEQSAGFPFPAPGLGDTLHAATHGLRVQAGSEAGPSRNERAMSPGHQFPEPGAAVPSAYTVPPAPGVDPASMPFAGLLTSPVAPAAPAAVNSMMGGHGMVYVPGYGLVPVMPFAMPAGMPPGMPPGVPLGMPFPMHHQASASISAPVNAGAGAEAPVMTAAQPAPPSAVRSFPQLSTFKSLEHLYEVVTCGDPMSSTLSFSAMTAADPSWRKGQAKRLFEIESAFKEMTERAAAESRQTGQTVSPRKHAKAMDVERAQHGSAKGKGATPVASWVKNVLGPLRAERNKQQNETRKAALGR